MKVLAIHIKPGVISLQKKRNTYVELIIAAEVVYSCLANQILLVLDKNVIANKTDHDIQFSKERILKDCFDLECTYRIFKNSLRKQKYDYQLLEKWSSILQENFVILPNQKRQLEIFN